MTNHRRSDSNEPRSHNPSVAGPAPRSSLSWTLAIVSLALFMTTLDNLVVTMALPSIRRSLGASIQSLEWTVNAYTLTFAVLLLTGAALGDRLRTPPDVRHRAGDLHRRERRGGRCRRAPTR